MSDLVTVIKREDFHCSRTRTQRTRDGGRFELSIAEAVAGIEARTHRAENHSLGEVPSGWQSNPAPKKAKPKLQNKAVEPNAEVKE